MKKGVYIVFEGIVGSGKTTVSKLLFGVLRENFPRRKIVWTREPGGSEVSNAIRAVVQATKFNEEMDPVAEAYLYAAARAHSLRTLVRPILDKKGVVIADRSFFTSVAFQGFGRGLGIDRVLKINEEAVDGLWPDRVFFIDLNIEKALGRTTDIDGDKFERIDKAFFHRAREGFLKVAKRFPDIVEVIDGGLGFEELFSQIKKSTYKLLK